MSGESKTPRGRRAARLPEAAPGVTPAAELTLEEIEEQQLAEDARINSGDWNAIGGGVNNLVNANAGVIAGGNNNTVTGVYAAVLGGDTNIASAQHALLTHFENVTGLRDACDALRCPEPRRIDRIFFKSSRSLELVPRRWAIDRRFVDARKRPLSDHLAVTVEFDWRKF